jgi:uncharacterized protein
MPLFMIYALDRPDSRDLRMENRMAHLDWAATFSDRIAMAGPVFAEDGETFAGSVFILECESLEAARTWHADDPYMRAGLFETVDIRALRWLLGDGPNAT